MTSTDNDWDRRILCSDGNCIGLIGPDGRCKVCGLPYEGELPVSAKVAVQDEEDSSDVSPEASSAGEQMPDTKESEAREKKTAGDDWEDRTLCIDGSCIGVIGPDGRCKVCGKSYPGKET